MLVDDLTDDSINEEFKAFVKSGKKKNGDQSQTNPDQKQVPHKKKVLQIKDKLKVIEYIEEGHTILNAVEKFHVPRTTIGTWLKSKDTLRAFKNTDKKTMHPGAQPKYKIKDEIISNLRKLSILFHLGDDEDYEENEDVDEEEEDEN